MSTIPSLQMLQGYLEVVSHREQQITSNMANVDTPGFRTKDVNFQSAMRQVMDEGNTFRLEPVAQEVIGLPERPDGNNVSIDRESMLLSQTQLQFQLGVQLVKSQFHTLYSAMRDN
jgi:flagellar basal-body rod protein FlgB